jgi:hypothetical protein
MLEAILSTLTIMGWLGIVLALLVMVNTICGTVFNIVAKKESFSWKRLFKGIGQAAIFYLSAVLTSVAFTMLPYINAMIANSFGVVLLTDELLNTLSSIGVLAVVVSSIAVQGKKAIANTVQLANMTGDTEEITWKVEEE